MRLLVGEIDFERKDTIYSLRCRHLEGFYKSDASDNEWLLTKKPKSPIASWNGSMVDGEEGTHKYYPGCLGFAPIHTKFSHDTVNIGIKYDLLFGMIL